MKNVMLLNSINFKFKEFFFHRVIRGDPQIDPQNSIFKVDPMFRGGWGWVRVGGGYIVVTSRFHVWNYGDLIKLQNYNFIRLFNFC